jgi:hypothetical protein
MIAAVGFYFFISLFFVVPYKAAQKAKQLAQKIEAAADKINAS